MKTSPSTEKISEMGFTGERYVPGKPELTHLYQEHISRYMFAAQFVEGRRVLDLGCGCGYGSSYLAEHGAKEVIGTDNSEEAIEFSKSRYSAKNLRFEVQDATAIQFDSSSFDVIIAFELIEHVNNYEKMLSGLKDALRRDGVFVMSTPNKATYETKDTFHIKEFYYDELKDVLSRYFGYVKIMHQMYPSALAIQNPSQSMEVLQVEIAHAPMYSEVAKDSLYFVAVCSDASLPRVREYIYLFSSRTLIIENYNAWKDWIKQLQQELHAKDARIIELDIRLREFERSKFCQAYRKARRLIEKIRIET